MHPHTNCPSCKETDDATQRDFVAACSELFRGSFAELYEKLQKRGFKIVREEKKA